MSEHAEYRARLARYQRRRLIARIVRIGTTLVAACLLIVGGALIASALQGNQPGDRAANQYIPGLDGSISLPRAGDYAIVRLDGELPGCVVTTAAGQQLGLTGHEEPGDPPLATMVFTAQAGRHDVTCEGGNDGVRVYAKDELFVVQHGYLFLALQSLPFLVGGVLTYVVGRVVARRLVPERLVPDVPS